MGVSSVYVGAFGVALMPSACILVVLACILLLLACISYLRLRLFCFYNQEYCSIWQQYECFHNVDAMRAGGYQTYSGHALGGCLCGRTYEAVWQCAVGFVPKIPRSWNSLS